MGELGLWPEVENSWEERYISYYTHGELFFLTVLVNLLMSEGTDVDVIYRVEKRQARSMPRRKNVMVTRRYLVGRRLRNMNQKNSSSVGKDEIMDSWSYREGYYSP